MSDGETVEQALARLKASLLSSFDIGGLFSRNEIAHKWKATYRSVLLREAVFWRLEDLLRQSYALHKMGHALGARILLRSAVETLAMLIYLNQQTAKVLDGTLNFHTFCDKTTLLVLGSKNKMTDYEALNINTVLKHCGKRYEFIEELYADLSECAHPNHEGLVMGYNRSDRENFVENFSNRWAEMYSKSHELGIMLVVDIFLHEYNVEWIEKFSELEAWLVNNDAELERTKDDPRM